MATIFRHEITNQTLRSGHSWKDENGIQHPSNWNIWSAEEKTAAGITKIVQENPPDSRLYIWSYNDNGTINKTAKVLEDSGSGETLVLGVKSNLKLDVNVQQGSLLARTDWYIIRKVDKGMAIPVNIQTWRDDIRIKGDAMESAIDDAVDISAIETLFVVYEDDHKTVKSGVLYDWPVLET